MITREAFVAEVVTWVGTPFHANQKLKGKGSDCIGIVAGSLENVGYMTGYRNDYPLRPDGSLRRVLAAKCDKVTGPPIAGDLLLMTFGDEPHHVAVFVGNNEIVHAYAQARKCVRQVYSDYWIGVTRATYRIPELT